MKFSRFEVCFRDKMCNHIDKNRPSRMARAPSEAFKNSDKLKTIVAVVLIPVSWGLVSMVETLI